MMQLHLKSNHRFLYLAVPYKRKNPLLLIVSLLATSPTLILKMKVTKKTFKIVNWHIYAVKGELLYLITLSTLHIKQMMTTYPQNRNLTSLKSESGNSRTLHKLKTKIFVKNSNKPA